MAAAPASLNPCTAGDVHSTLRSIHLLLVALLFASALLSSLHPVHADDAIKFLTWNVTYRNLAILDGNIPKQVININGQFPGPQIDAVTNDFLVINVYNSLNEPFLLTWNGIWQRRTSWQDGVSGTNCPIPPGRNFTYSFQVKDQIGSYFYFPSTGLHKSAGGYGGFKIDNRVIIPLPYPSPDGELFVLIGDWYNANHTTLRRKLDAGGQLDMPDGVLINGRGPFGTTLSLQPGKTYRLRVSNVGTATSLNFRIEGHKMRMVETEGSHTVQNLYANLDIHVGQSYTLLVTTDQAPRDYYMVASTRFTSPVLTGIGVVHYLNSQSKVSGPLPGGPTIQIDYSLNQARTIRWNLTANAARPNPQGSFHYGMINVSETVLLYGSAASVNGKLRYAVNGMSYVAPETPLKIADYFNLPGVFSLGSMPTSPHSGSATIAAPVLAPSFRAFLEVVFQNNENVVNSWHIDGYSFFVVGMDGGIWTTNNRRQYNLFDAVSRSTTQVYPHSWTAILLELDNVGMWNVRSQLWERQYLGQQFYMRVFNPEISFRNEAPIPNNVLLCGKAAKGGHRRRRSH
ncbi:hypothetical protein L7F22_063957 [Adiantum nelumboides]|nr:hypothetical protein [Adiantum nelumboides]